MIGRPSQAQRVSTQDEATPPTQKVGGRYRIEKQLGRGGAASVYKALDLASGKPVALKRLAENASARLASLFELEYHTLSTVKHKNIVEVYDYGSDALGPYYVMELLEGQDLSHFRRLDWQSAARHACEVASALSVLHARRLVHRDVSARNVWCVPDGSLKLIDFGALTSFGTCGDVVGTPPHVAPEALQSRPLDQRTDLYALGALLYWLLTGTHAYPARSLRELPQLWTEPAVSVLEQLERLGHDARDLPKELDALVMALLSPNPLARPGTTGEVIDGLSAMLGLAPAPRSDAADIGLSQPNLTGRERERKEFRRQLEQLGQGHGEATILAARRGDGRTRLLNELAVDARISGAHVVHVPAKSVSGSHAVADAIILRLLDSLPDITRDAAKAHASVLGHLSRAVEQRLGVPLKAMAQVAGEARANIHEALSAVLIAIAKETPLVVLVDDLESADESSTAWLATLSSRLTSTRLLLCIAIEETNESDRSLAIKTLRHHGRRVALKSLTGPETQKLLSSLFGEVPYLLRMSERLYRATQGNPARVVDLSRHLVREGVITNVNGTWVLPQELPQELLNLDGEERVRIALARLSPEAKQLGAALSVRRGPLPLEMCKALSDLPSAQLFSALEELAREGILSSTGLGYHFEDDVYRRALRLFLSTAEAQRFHGKLAAFIMATPDVSQLERLSALVHAMEGGDTHDAPDRIARITLDLNQGDPDMIVEAAPVMERAVKVMRASGRRDQEAALLLGTLLVAGYFSDRRLVARYGDRSVAALSSALRVPLMHKLRPWLGKKLSLFVGLITAALSMRFRPLPGKPSLKEVITLYFQVVSSYAGVNTICVDPEAVLRMNPLFEPFTALGKDHIASFMYEFNQNLALTVQERFSEASRRWQACIKKLEDPNCLRGFPENIKLRYLGGALYAYGVLECWRDSPTGLAIAERLESSTTKLYQMTADQLRSIYYAHQGNRELYERYRARAEQHAIQRGSAWQIETWAPGAALTFSLRTHDAMGLKESHEQLARLEKRIPSLSLLARRAQGVFLLLRRRFEEALPLLEDCLAESPRAVVGWARAHGGLAACLNQLGWHERAREVCETVLRQLDPEDLSFTGMTLYPQIELAYAEAGLDEIGKAIARLDALITKHTAANGPLTLGALHEARARVALMARDKASCEEHAAAMEKHYLGTGIASLIALCDAFRREQRRAFQVGPKRALGDTAEIVSTGFSAGPTALERVLADEKDSLEGRAKRALVTLAEDMGDVHAALFIKVDHASLLSAYVGGDEPDLSLSRWVEERMLGATHDDVTQTDFADAEDPDLFVQGAQRYRIFLLSTIDAQRQFTVGALVFAEPAEKRLFLPQGGAQTLAQWLYKCLNSPSVTTSLLSRHLTQES
jgi:serine/threonine protein kinase/tetratricopeptide (TPR) repeat protein